MTPAEDWINRSILAVVPLAIIVAGCCLSQLPRSLVMEALSILAVWLCISLPLGVVVGHCALSEG
jgi:hypothetical protein